MLYGFDVALSFYLYGLLYLVLGITLIRIGLRIGDVECCFAGWIIIIVGYCLMVIPISPIAFAFAKLALRAFYNLIV